MIISKHSETANFESSVTREEGNEHVNPWKHDKDLPISFDFT